MGLNGISIVIPAYNEEKFLPQTLLTAINSWKYFSFSHEEPVEVVVVNNASTDLTKETAEKHGARVVYHPIRNISSVRNAGIAAANYELIVMIDADSFLPEDALVKI